MGRIRKTLRFLSAPGVGSPIRAESSAEQAAREAKEQLAEQNRLLAEQNRLLGAPPPRGHVISQAEYEKWKRAEDRAAARRTKKQRGST